MSSFTPVSSTASQNQYSEINSPTVSQSLLCYICLETHSDPDKLNEIVICDNCGIMVHEVCYGIVDSALTENEMVNDSCSQPDDSIELWFCDECKNDSKHYCELCPKRYVGPMKETEWGRWVHMVCALYTPSVQFHYTETMSDITLTELNFQHWGSNPCEICTDSDERISGYTVKCNASLCKRHFHVTCAQSQGLTCQSLDLKNPFQVFCKDHLDSENILQINSKKTNYIQMIENIKKKYNYGKIKDNKHIEINLPTFCKKYEAQKKLWPKPWVPLERQSKPLHSNFKAVKYFQIKYLKFRYSEPQYTLDNIFDTFESLDQPISVSNLNSNIELLYRMRKEYDSIYSKLTRNLKNYQNCDKKYLSLLKEEKKAKKCRVDFKNKIQENINLGLMSSSMQNFSHSKILMMKFNKTDRAICNFCNESEYIPLMKLCTKCNYCYIHYGCIDKSNKEDIRGLCKVCYDVENEKN